LCYVVLTRDSHSVKSPGDEGLSLILDPPLAARQPERALKEYELIRELDPDF